MDIKHLQYFVVSVDMGSFHSAAKVLFTTQSHVSKTIKALEQELNIVLLERKSNGVITTPEGEKIYRYAVNVLKEVQSISDIKGKQERYFLSIASISSNRLALLTSEYYNKIKMKEVQLDYFEGNVEEVITRVHRRQSQLGFVYISDRHIAAFQNQIQAKGLIFQKLKDTRLYLFVGSNHPSYGAKSVDVQLIYRMKLLCNYEEHYSLIHHIGHIKEDTPLKNETFLMSITNSDYFMDYMLKNTDYGCLCSDINSCGKRERGIHKIPVSLGNQNIAFGYVKRKNDELEKIPADFLAFLKQKLQDEKES
ncbi:DNA-binding transcriptional LysR family regulator [Lachnotalea glycerini]|uniref:DNA-binding transcriptional LysR family regulator n=1 Tax=Lachnotalea glycerini TaxID=1763509 RepID=A0A255IN95_9FIRM|nr:LysR family transcriptional regulator [Lachnotalea glycerini]PXV89416.1 DNA-binding transcriptional LysR family regulator [Lachnotalea glycerini]RDY32395.1 LysR family transcriptional regulator [Lachnotalea glycerini]